MILEWYLLRLVSTWGPFRPSLTFQDDTVNTWLRLNNITLHMVIDFILWRVCFSFAKFYLWFDRGRCWLRLWATFWFCLHLNFCTEVSFMLGGCHSGHTRSWWWRWLLRFDQICDVISSDDNTQCRWFHKRELFKLKQPPVNLHHRLRTWKLLDGVGPFQILIHIDTNNDVVSAASNILLGEYDKQYCRCVYHRYCACSLNLCSIVEIVCICSCYRLHLQQYYQQDMKCAKA